MLTALNRFLKLAGLELRPAARSIKRLQSAPARATAGWVVEFIGTQGIGKSTLNNAVHKSLQDNWFFRADLGTVGPAQTRSPEIEALHRALYFQKIHHLEETQPDPWKSITVARQMSRVISESLTMLSHSFARGFFLDEGLFKNFTREVLELDADTAAPLWQNRAFVYLRARDPASVIARYRGRVQDRQRTGGLQRAPTDEELNARIKQDDLLYDQVTDMAARFGCPVLVVCAEDDHAENVRKILEFEQMLRQKNA